MWCNTRHSLFVMQISWFINAYTHLTYSYFEKGCRKKCARDNPEGQYGIQSIHRSWHCSCRTYVCCFPLAACKHISPWLLMPFFQISSKNSVFKFKILTCVVLLGRSNRVRGIWAGVYDEGNMSRRNIYCIVLLLLSANVSAPHSPVTIKAATNFSGSE